MTTPHAGTEDVLPADSAASRRPTVADVTVVVPARNAAWLLPECLASINRQFPGGLVLVDGLSSDSTVEIARSLGATVISDEGRGLPYARAAGAMAARTRFVALVDADVVLPDGSLAALLEEFLDDGYVALQAGLESVAGPGYWGQALAWHHRTGLSRYWFGLVATLVERDRLLEHGFDAEFESGEDIELRWRLARAGEKAGVSRKVIVQHRFDDTWEFARGQFRADGRGLARMVRKHGIGGARLLLLPAAAAVRGAGLCVLRGRPQLLMYFLAFAAGNYAAMAGELFARRPR